MAGSQQFTNYIILPLATQTAATAKFCELEVIQFVAETTDFAVKLLSCCRSKCHIVILHTEVNLIDNFKKINLELHYREQRSGYLDTEFTFAVFIADKIAVDISTERSPQTKELDIVGFDEAKRTKIVQLFLGKGESAEVVYLSVDFLTHFHCELDVLIATLKQINSVEIGMLVKHYLVHIEFVKVGVKQRHNTRG
jgi:hypothetical protein